MAEALFFILGALFCLALLVAVVALVPAAGQVGTVRYTPEPFAFSAPYPSPPRSARQRRNGPEPLRLAAPKAPTRTEREAYRVAAGLDRAEAALTRISNLGEPAAAKIAAQTLRRLHSADAPAKARLQFALSRLELLSLRPEPAARQAARVALNGLI